MISLTTHHTDTQIAVLCSCWDAVGGSDLDKKIFFVQHALILLKRGMVSGFPPVSKAFRGFLDSDPNLVSYFYRCSWCSFRGHMYAAMRLDPDQPCNWDSKKNKYITLFFNGNAVGQCQFYCNILDFFRLYPSCGLFVWARGPLTNLQLNNGSTGFLGLNTFA